MERQSFFFPSQTASRRVRLAYTTAHAAKFTGCLNLQPSTLNQADQHTLENSHGVGSVDVMQTRARASERAGERERARECERERAREGERETHKADGTVVVVQLVDACVLLRAGNL